MCTAAVMIVRLVITNISTNVVTGGYLRLSFVLSMFVGFVL